MVALVLVTWCSAACDFNKEPLFEPRDAGDSGASARQAARPKSRAGLALLWDDDAGPRDRGDAAAPHDVDVDSGAVPVIDAGASCVPDAWLGCEQGDLRVCSADGRTIQRRDCGMAGCNDAAGRCNDCRPNSVSCRDGKLLRCDADGRVAFEQTCELGCVPADQAMPACRRCSAGAVQCRDGNQRVCAPDGSGWQTTPCESGCDDSGLFCRGTLVPSNLPRAACSWSSFVESERTIDVDSAFDTDRECPRVIAQGDDLPALCVLSYEHFRLTAGAVLRVTGSRALVIVSRSIELSGRVSVSAQGADEGPGSLQTGDGQGDDGVGRVEQEGNRAQMWTELPANAGGGGGGHATDGAPGGGAPGQCGPKLRCAEPGAGGQAYGDETLVPLVGGAAGGRNSAARRSMRRGRAGGGGGALQLVACETLTLGSNAVLDANGGGGQGGFPGDPETDSETPGAGAGGGSGGAILVQAREIKAAAGAIIVANGGGGGGGATHMAEGSESNQPGDPGEDGQLSDTAASGGEGAGDSQSGGMGGSDTPPTQGGRARQRTQAAGGGGGAAGRIRIETASGSGSVASILMSPPATYGTVAVE